VEGLTRTRGSCVLLLMARKELASGRRDEVCELTCYEDYGILARVMCGHVGGSCDACTTSI
jgi:hypothetical protein